MKEADEEDDNNIGIDTLFEPPEETEIGVAQARVDTTFEDNFKDVKLTDKKGK